MVVADFAVVDVPPSKRALSCPSSQLVLIACGYCSDNPWSGGGNISRQMTAIRPWIADQFVTLIESLGKVKGLLGAEAEQAIGMTLKFRKVVKQRCQHPLRLGSE